MRNKSGKMNVRNLSSRAVGVLATCLVGIAVVLGPVGLTLAADTWFDDWNDANDVNPPLNWEHSAAFPGLYDASSGDYLLAGQDLQEGIGFADNDDEIIRVILDLLGRVIIVGGGRSTVLPHGLHIARYNILRSQLDKDLGSDQ